MKSKSESKGENINYSAGFSSKDLPRQAEQGVNN